MLLLMDFDKCEDGIFDDDHEQYQSQINQLSFIDNRTQHNGQEYIFVNNAQITIIVLYTYVRPRRVQGGGAERSP